MDLLNEWLRAFGALWTSPFYYIAGLYIALQYRKQTIMERKLFSVKLHAWRKEWGRSLLWGACVGVAVSAAFLFIGGSLTVSTLIFLWIIALLLSLFRVRYLCFAYAAGVLGLLQMGVHWIGEPGSLPEGFAVLIREVGTVHMPSVFVLVGVLHVAEAVLVAAMAGRMAMPLFFEGKRGKPIGGFRLQAFWPVPLLLLTPFPLDVGVGSSAMLPWPTLFGGGGGASGHWSVVAFPVIIGFHSIALARRPESKSRTSAVRLAVFGLAVTAVGIALFFVPFWWVLLIAALLTFGLHEWIVTQDFREETKESPFFIHDERGLKVLAVLPGSPAEELGFKPGDIVRKVNGLPVRDRAGLHGAMQTNGAFVKMEVLNHDGEVRFVQRALYANEHHQLGLILCPDDQTLHVVRMAEGGLFSLIGGSRRRTLNRDQTGTGTEIARL